MTPHAVKLTLTGVGREIAAWRQHFRARRHAAGADGTPLDTVAQDTLFGATEWSPTEWPDTQAEALALSAPIDLTTEPPR